MHLRSRHGLGLLIFQGIAVARAGLTSLALANYYLSGCRKLLAGSLFVGKSTTWQIRPWRQPYIKKRGRPYEIALPLLLYLSEVNRRTQTYEARLDVIVGIGHFYIILIYKCLLVRLFANEGLTFGGLEVTIVIR